MVLQLLPRYVIKDKLMLLLESNFGRQDFTVTHFDDLYMLDAPRPLTFGEIREVSFYPNITAVVNPDPSLLAYARFGRRNPVLYHRTSGGHNEKDGRVITLKLPYQLPGSKVGKVVAANWEIYPDLEKGAITRTVPCLAVSQKSTVYAVKALITWTDKEPQSDSPQPQPMTAKLALKQLHPKTSLEQFLVEFDALSSTHVYNHPNIVQLLQAFRQEVAGIKTFNILFPRAIGDLKQLFRGSLDHLSLTPRYHELWGQFEGLASALEYLHDNCKTAHRDIKPSNVLLYDEPESGLLRARITDFGLAINLRRAVSWNLGTAKPKFVWSYDTPKIRTNVTTPTAERLEMPSPEELLKADIWKLGALFTELLTFLLLKSRGHGKFRKFITTTVDRMTSDTIEEFRFDGGERVKPEVLNWLSRLSRRSPMAAELEPLLTTMLGDALGRPDAQKVSRSLREFSSSVYSDGVRVVRFTRSDRVARLGITDRVKEGLESLLRSRIDWWPLAQGLRSCAPTNMRVSWKWKERWLTVDAPIDAVLAYRDKSCAPVSRPPAYPSQPPPAYQPGSSSQTANLLDSLLNQSGQPHQEGQWYPIQPTTNPPGLHAQLTGQGGQGVLNPPPVTAEELYWCIEKPFSDQRQISVSHINVQRISSDEELFRDLLAEYNRKRGIISRIFSWKSCQDVEFLQFRINKHGDQHISRISQGIPHDPPRLGYLYTRIQPDILHMKMIGMELVTGMSDYKGATGLQTLEGIPKRLKNVVTWNRGDEGWGIRAIQGWSLKKVSLWIIGAEAVGAIFAACWLVFVDTKDIQNAFMPMLYLLATMMAIPGVPAILNFV